MASEAKIGLLLGLVIIFVIAFVLNELPRFSYSADDRPAESVGAAEPAGLGAHLRDHLDTGNTIEAVAEPRVSPSPKDESEEPEAYATLPVAPPIPPKPSVDEIEQTTARESVEQLVWEALYIVAEGDNLAEIAKKFYGPIEGNRRANVFRIFAANRKLLSSPDKIRVGQKLVIPPLVSAPADTLGIGDIFPNWMFETVESIGMRHLPAEDNKPKPNRQYVVREGDSLWAVAASQLGDPTRYKEIGRLNARILKDENTLSVGMRLVLPAQ